jgi:transcriptional regulator with XRE-family HTH domain
MGNKPRTDDAVSILHKRYVKDDPGRKEALEQERSNAEIAFLVYDLRRQAGLTQRELAELVGTTQSVISRLEDADYDGHSLSMLRRIAAATKQTIAVVSVADDPAKGAVRDAFRLFVELLRRKHNLTVEELAKRADVERTEIIAMERNSGYRPSPRTLHKLSQFYKIPERRLLVLAGALKEVPQEFRDEASRFAAQSESFATLTGEEKKALDEFMRFLRTEG